MMDRSHFLHAWETGTAPPPDRLDLYNHSLSLHILGSKMIIIEGYTAWDPNLHKYVFHFLGHLAGPVYMVKLGFAVYDRKEYLSIRSTLRKKYGIFVTEGIHDRQEPFGQSNNERSFSARGPRLFQ